MGIRTHSTGVSATTAAGGASDERRNTATAAISRACLRNVKENGRVHSLRKQARRERRREAKPTPTTPNATTLLLFPAPPPPPFRGICPDGRKKGRETQPQKMQQQMQLMCQKFLSHWFLQLEPIAMII